MANDAIKMTEMTIVYANNISANHSFLMANTSNNYIITYSELKKAVLKLSKYSVANSPLANTQGEGSLIYVSNGDAGSPCIAISNGSVWLKISLGDQISAS